MNRSHAVGGVFCFDHLKKWSPRQAGLASTENRPDSPIKAFCTPPYGNYLGRSYCLIRVIQIPPTREAPM